MTRHGSQWETGEARRRQILAFVSAYIDEHGWAPTYAEIGAAVGLSSKSTVHRHLKELADQGLLRVGSDKRVRGSRQIALPR